MYDRNLSFSLTPSVSYDTLVSNQSRKAVSKSNDCKHQEFPRRPTQKGKDSSGYRGDQSQGSHYQGVDGVPEKDQRERKVILTMNEVTGKFTYDQDSKRFHRYRIEADQGVVGTVYVPKDLESLPDRIVLERKEKEEVV